MLIEEFIIVKEKNNKSFTSDKINVKDNISYTMKISFSHCDKVQSLIEIREKLYFILID